MPIALATGTFLVLPSLILACCHTLCELAPLTDVEMRRLARPVSLAAGGVLSGGPERTRGTDALRAAPPGGGESRRLRAGSAEGRALGWGGRLSGTSLSETLRVRGWQRLTCFFARDPAMDSVTLRGRRMTREVSHRETRW